VKCGREKGWMDLVKGGWGRERFFYRQNGFSTEGIKDLRERGGM